jgi:fatty-acyl-CoA synthase
MHTPPKTAPLAPPHALPALTGAQDPLRKWARVNPQQVALEHPSHGVSLTYRELDARVTACAEALSSLGVGEGDRVALLARNRVEIFELLFACVRIGAAFTPLNWRLAGAELADIMAHCLPRVLIADSTSAGLAAEALAGAPEAARLSLRPLAGEPGATLAGALDLEGLMAGVGREGQPHLESARARDPELIAMILYTSGTTGRPKGVMLPHRQVLWNAINTVYACDLSPSDAALAFLPLFHTGGLNCLATPTLYRGGRVVLMDAFDPVAALDLMESRRITSVVAVPAMYQSLLDVGLEGRDLSALRTILCGGAPCPDALLEAWLSRGFAFRQGFGMTEVGPNCFSLPAWRLEDKRGSVGQVILHCEARVVDAEGRALGAGEVGELWLGGPIVSAGYLLDPAATAASFEGGWLKTGDLARYDEEGFFYVAGRKKEMFISGGENVYPAEIENLLLGAEFVAEAAVVGVPDERWGEVGLAAVVLRAGVEMTADEVRAWCRARLAGFKTPKHVRLCAALPRNASGKVLKRAVAELL